jgi:hypothetical protein
MFDAVATWLPWITLLMLAAGVYLARQRRRAVLAVGLGVVGGMLVLAAALMVGRGVLVCAVPEQGAPSRPPATTSWCGSCARHCGRWRCSAWSSPSAPTWPGRRDGGGPDPLRPAHDSGAAILSTAPQCFRPDCRGLSKPSSLVGSRREPPSRPERWLVAEHLGGLITRRWRPSAAVSRGLASATVDVVCAALLFRHALSVGDVSAVSAQRPLQCRGLLEERCPRLAPAGDQCSP